jgi:hypothetical protein
MSLIVEFCGMPGSGKTTLALDVHRQLTEAGVTVSRTTHRSLAAKGRAAIRYRRSLWTAARVLSGSSRALVKKVKAVRFLLVTLERIDVARRDPSDTVYLFDEGWAPRHFLLLVDADHVRPDTDLATDRPIPGADVIVHREATADLVLDRMRGRGRQLAQRFDHLDEDARATMLERAGTMLRAATRRLAQAPPDPGRPPHTLIEARDSDDTAEILALLLPR